MNNNNKILSDITVHMKYAKYIPELNRRETWEELVTRNKEMHQKRYPDLYNEIEDKITVQPNWETSTDRDIDFTRTYSRKFYDYAVRKVVNEVNYHKAKQDGNNIKKIINYKLKSTLASTLMKLSK